MKFLQFAALVASASAINLNSEIYPHPDYYADGYSNTWKYTEMEHIVNETAYVIDATTAPNYDPWVFDEGAFAGSTATDNAIVVPVANVQLSEEQEQSLVYMQEQHKAAHNQQMLEQIMLTEWTLNKEYPLHFNFPLKTT